MTLDLRFPRSLLAIALGAGLASPVAAAERELLNSSYDIARELFSAINPEFIAHWQRTQGEEIAIQQSHGGSSAQARAILQGLRADVVTYNQVTDVQVLADDGLVAEDWQQALPNNASPYYSTTAFLVRKGNPKGIEGWDDLDDAGVEIVFPNPKTSGNARYTYLAATAYAREAFGGDERKVIAFIDKIFDNVPVFDTGGRAATTTFVEREIGDVLITFEAETRSIAREFGEDRFEIVVPSVSLLAEFPVAIVDKVVDKRGSRDLARTYLDFLYTPEGQTIAAERGHRINEPSVAEKFKDRFPQVRLVTVEDVFGGWEKVHEEHFASGALLDRIYGER